VIIRVASFNIGLEQTMIESERRWEGRHVISFRSMLANLGHVAKNDFVFCSEVGAKTKGFLDSNVDFERVVQEALPGATCSSSGAYLHIWNVQKKATAVVQSGTWTASTTFSALMHWQAFDLIYQDAPPLTDRDAPQLAGRDALQHAAPKVGLLVGNMHIPCPGKGAPNTPQKQRIVKQALQHLTTIKVHAWRDRADFPVMRLLVGDCNLAKHEAEVSTQEVHKPSLTALQRDFNVRRWQVFDVQFPTQILEAAWRQ
jgi:hypothetical protein